MLYPGTGQEELPTAISGPQPVPRSAAGANSSRRRLSRDRTKIALGQDDDGTLSFTRRPFIRKIGLTDRFETPEYKVRLADLHTSRLLG